MSSLTFDRPVGAVADTRELEYIAALHQSHNVYDDHWFDASIRENDVRNFLMSRHGIVASGEEVRKLIFRGLAGGDSEDDCIDLTEVMAILLIPYLAKVVQDQQAAPEETPDAHVNANDNENAIEIESTRNPVSNRGVSEPSLFAWEQETLAAANKERLEMRANHGASIISNVLDMILMDCCGSNTPPPLTKDLLRTIFSYYKEEDLILDNDLLDEMIESACANAGPGGEDIHPEDAVLDAKTFARALTNDIQLYKPRNEFRMSTHFEDAFGLDRHEKGESEYIGSARSSNPLEYEDTTPHAHAHADENQQALVGDCDGDGPSRSSSSSSPSDEQDDLNAGATDYKQERKVRAVATLSQIDFMADNFRSSMQYVSAYLAFILLLFLYYKPTAGISICGTNPNFACNLLQSVLNWMIVMLSVSMLGLVSVTTLSLGNDPNDISIQEIIGGLAATGFLLITPLFVKFDFIFFENISLTTDDDVAQLNRLGIFLSYFLAVCLVLCQIANTIRLVVSNEKLASSKILTMLVRGTSIKSEVGLKQAAAYKVHTMVKNAYELHKDHDGNVSKGGSTNALALMNFTKRSEETELCGGKMWAWKAFFSKSLLYKEGVLIRTKIFVSSFAQILGTLIVISIMITVQEDFKEGWSAAANPDNTYVDCNATFNYDSCSFPQNAETGNYTGVAFCERMNIPDSCIPEFQEMPEEMVDTFCEFFLNSNPYADLFGNRCPQATVPSPNVIYAATDDSINATHYCASPISGCIFDDEIEDIDGGLCMLGVQNLYPFIFVGETCVGYPEIKEVLDDKEAFDALYGPEVWMPETWMFATSFSVGYIGAIIAALYNIFIIMPSSVSTIMQFRSGALPSLRDKREFKQYRTNILQTTTLLGATFWGGIIMTVIIIVALTSLTFVSVWQITRPYIFEGLAFLIGVAITLLLKVLVTVIAGKETYAVFYKKRPLFGNLMSLAFEAWNTALTIWFVLTRSIKLAIITIIFLGRCDRPLLAQGVGMLGPMPLDGFPVAFRKDILAFEAHRHPYIERLGLMYMMKLRHGDNFGRVSGSIWRLLFVFALMPWLRKYRIIEANNKEPLSNDQEEQERRTDGNDVNVAFQPVSAVRRRRDLESENNSLKEEIATLKAKVV